MSKEYDWRKSVSAPVEDQKPQNAFEAVSRGREYLKSGSGKITSKMPYICLVLVILFDIVNQFVETGFSNFSWGLLLNVLTSVAFTVLVFYVFFPVGKTGREKSAESVSIYSIWHDTCRRIRENGLLNRFRAYCRKRSTDEVQAAKDAQFEALENLYVSAEEYEAKYRKAKRRALRKYVRRGEISKQAYKQIRKMRKQIKPPVYNPLYILTSADARTRNAFNGKDNREKVVLATKPIIAVSCGVVLDMIAFSQKKVDGWAVVAIAICLSIFKIILASFSGYYAGYSTEIHNEHIVSAKSTFLGEFMEGTNNDKIDLHDHIETESETEKVLPAKLHGGGTAPGVPEKRNVG